MTAQPRIDWSALPVAMPDGQLLPHLSARLRTQTIDALFVGSGGFERALAWIEQSDDNYKEFFKIWAKGAAKSTSVELNAGQGVEDLLARLDAGDHAKVISPYDPNDWSI